MIPVLNSRLAGTLTVVDSVATHQAVELQRKRRVDYNPRSIVTFWQFEAGRMQHQAPDFTLAHRAVEIGIAIFVVPGDLVSLGLAMNPDLMRPSSD